MFESSCFQRIIANKISVKGECLTGKDFENVEEWNAYVNHLFKLKHLLLNTYTKQQTKVSNGQSPFSIARKEAIICMRELLDRICNLANINKIGIDNRAIHYSFNFITIKRKITSNPQKPIQLIVDFIVNPQIVFESILYCRINNIKIGKETTEIYKSIGQLKNVTQELDLHFREVDFTNSSEPVVIYVYFNIISCQSKKHTLENVTALVNCEMLVEPIKINVHFCTECLRYFIQETALNQYQKKYGVIIFRRLYDERYCEDRFPNDDRYLNYQLHSELWLYGYNVQQGKLTIEERKKLLSFLIFMNMLSKSDIIQTITRNIEAFKNRERYRDAIAKWNEDLKYIQDYNINDQRHVMGQLVSSETKCSSR